MNAPSLTPLKLCINCQNFIFYLDLKNIIHLTSEGNYTKIFFQKNEKEISFVYCSKNLGYYEDLLNNNNFMRVHHKHIVNVAYVFMFDKNNNQLELASGKMIDVSFRRKQEVLNKLNSHFTS